MTKIDESWYVRPKDKNFPVRKGAGGLILRKRNNRIFVGLVRIDRFSDYIFPKGGSENGEVPLDTAVREIGEETGIRDLRMLSDLGVCERLTYRKNYWSKMHYFLFVTQQKNGLATDPFESYQIEWFNIDKLPPMFWPEQRDLIEKNKGKIKKLIRKEG